MAAALSTTCTADPGAIDGNEPAQVVVAPLSVSLLIGDTVSVHATAIDARGQPLENVRFVWKTADSTVTIVDTSGLIYGRSEGTTTASAIVGEIRGDVSVVVETPEPGWRDIGSGCGVWHDDVTYCWSWPDLSGNMTGPVPLPGAPNFRMFTAGQGHWCGISTAGEAYCWGSNLFGQIGDGTTTDRTTPTAVASASRFQAIAAGALHTCAITVDGEAYCWGAGASGQLGIGAVSERCGSLPCSRLPVRVNSALRFKAVAAGGYDRVGPGALAIGSSCAIDQTGSAFCWGDNEYRTLGDGTRSDRDTPTRVTGNHVFEAIEMGGAHTCGLSGTRILCWGLNGSGELGTVLPDEPAYHCMTGDTRSSCSGAPVPIASSETYTSVVTNGFHTCGITRFGAVFCWGLNDLGQVGNGTRSLAVRTPTRVLGGWTFLQLATDLATTCGIAPDRAGYCWGRGGTTPRRLPDPGE